MNDFASLDTPGGPGGVKVVEWNQNQLIRSLCSSPWLFITFWCDIFPDPAYKHLGIECDSCSVLPIQGKRYKCLFCPELDLCEDCHSKQRPSPCKQTHDLVDYEVIFLLILHMHYDVTWHYSWTTASGQNCLFATLLYPPIYLYWDFRNFWHSPVWNIQFDELTFFPSLKTNWIFLPAQTGFFSKFLG